MQLTEVWSSETRQEQHLKILNLLKRICFFKRIFVKCKITASSDSLSSTDRNYHTMLVWDHCNPFAASYTPDLTCLNCAEKRIPVLAFPDSLTCHMRNLITTLFKQVAVRNMEASRSFFLLSGQEQDVLWFMGDPLFPGHPVVLTHWLPSQLPPNTFFLFPLGQQWSYFPLPSL